MQTKVRVNILRYLRRWGKRTTGALVTMVFLFTSLFPVFQTPFLFPPQKVFAAANIPISLKLDNFNDTSQLQLNGTSATVLYNTVNVLRLNEAVVGPKASTFTGNRISLANDRSFSTYFKFRISGAYNPYNPSNPGGDGFTFTVQTMASTARGTSNPAMASDGITPSVNVEFDTYEDGSHTDHIGINTNGNPASLAQANASALVDGNEHHVWVDYDGLTDQIEVRMNSTDTRPATALLTKTGLDLAAILDSDEVFAGFTAASGSAYEAHDILMWYFTNDYAPIDVINNTYTDASQLTLVADPAIDTNLSTITASVTDMSGNPIPNIPVSFSSDLGMLSESVVTSDAGGQAVVTLDAGMDTGTANVKAVAQGGAYGTVNVGLAGDPDQFAVTADKTDLEITYNGTDAANSVTQALGALPAAGANGTTITWVSDNTAVVSNDGQTVNRPSYIDGDASVTLIATISKGTATDTKAFPLTVKALTMSDAEAVAADKAALVITYNGLDTANSITQALGALPATGSNGTTITWASDNTAVVSNDGQTVNRPSYTAGDASVTLIATISKGTATDTKDFPLMVKALTMSDTEAVDLDKQALAITFNGSDTANSLTQALGALPVTGSNGTTITWVSNNTGIVSNDGQTVNRPAYADGDAAVNLTATITIGAVSNTKVFPLTVKALAMSDAEAVAADKAALGITFNGSDTAGSVTQNLTLPGSGSNGTIVRWSSSNPSLVHYTGRVTRPSRSAGDTKVTLTAAVIKGMAVEKKDFTVKVLADQIAPTIISTVPAAGANNIARGEPITVKFSEPIRYGEGAKDIKINAFRVTSYYLFSTTEKERIWAWLSVSGDTLTITPRKTLDSYTQYEVIIPGDSVRDLAGNSFNIPRKLYDYNYVNARIFEFRTGKHSEPPVIVSHYPEDGASGIALNVPITVTLDEPVKLGPSAYMATLKDSGDNKIPITMKAEGKTLTIKPDVILENASAYRVTLPVGSVRTTSDKDLAVPCTFGFTTGTFRVASQPEDGETNIGLNKVMIVKYDGNMQPGPNIGGITVRDPENNTIPRSVMVNDGILLINPDDNLEFATEYTVKVPAGALTAADGTANGEYVFSFSTTEEITDTLPGFDSTPAALIEGDWVDFDATGVFDQAGKDYDRKITEYSWDFGDGNSGSGAASKHAYDSPGTYTVTLNMTDDKGQGYTLSNEVLIKSLGEVNMVVSPEGTAKYRYYNPEWYEVLFDYGPEFTVTLDSDGIPLPERQVEVYKGDTRIYGFSTEWNGETKITIDQSKLDFGNNLLTFVSYGKTVQRMVRYTEGETSTYKIKIKNSPGIEGLKFWINGAEKTPELIDGFYKFTEIETGLHQIKITAPYYYDKEYTVDLCRDEQTDTVEMEPDEPSDIPVVRWVTSAYSDSRKGSKDFIKGVSVPINLIAKVDWKGHKPGYIKFITPDRTYKEADGIRYLDLGSYIRVGGRVRVVAVSGFGTESAAVDAGIRIVPRPPVGSVKFNQKTGEYEFSMNSSMPSAKSPNAPGSLPFFAGNSLGLDSDHFKLSGGMTKNGKLVFNIAAGGAKEKTKKRLLKAPKKEYKVDVGGVEIEGFLGAELTYAYRQDIKEWAFEGGTITVQVNGSATKQQYFLIPGVFIPGYVRGTIGVNTETGLDISRNFVTNKTEYQGMVLIGPNAEVAIGAGGGEFYIEGYLNGEVDFIYTFPTNELTVEAELNGGVRAQAWIFSWENNMLHYEWEYPEESPSAAGARSVGLLPAGLAPETLEFKPSSREYMEKAPAWLAPAGNFRALSAAPESSIVMQNSIFPYPDPVMLNDGGETVLAWVADNPARSAMNRTEIKFARFNGAGWSAPEFMSLDGTGDFSPKLGKTSGGIMAVWENVYQVLPESAVLTDMSAGMEIAAAMSDNGLTGWSNFAGLTDNNYLDHAPVLAASGDSAVLMWTANRANNMTGSAAEPNEIMFSRWDGVSWSEPAVVLSNLGAMTYTTAAYNGSEGAFAYTVDGDDNTGTTGDQELYVITYDGTGWSSPVMITDNQIQDANPQMAYLDNQLLLTWYQDGNIVFAKGLQGTPDAISGISGANADFKLACNGDRLALAYNQPAARGQNIYTTIYDAAVDSWSYPVQLTSEEGYLNSSLGPVFDGAGNLMVAHSKVELVTTEVDGVEYTNPGQADLGLVTFKPKHDLAVDASGIQLSENNPVPGSTVTVTADIRNDGDFSEKDVEAAFYNGDPAAGGTMIGATQVIHDVIPARGSATASVTWTVPIASGPYAVYVVVDPEEKNQDSSRVNNTAYTEAVAPDIQISDLQYESLGGTKYIITAEIANIGSMDVGSTEINLYEGENEDTLVTSQQVAALESGDQTQAVFVWDAAGKEFVNGEFRLSTRLNSPAGLNEYTGENNIYKLALIRETLYAESFSPAENSRTAPVDQGITIKFNTDIQEGPTFADMVLLDETGTEVAAAKTVAGHTLVINPSAPLGYEKTYTLILKAGDVTGINGSDLESEFVLDFTTDKLHTNPVVSFTYPADDMSDAVLGDDINIVFNEEVLAGDNFAGVRVIDNYGWHVDVTAQISGNILVLNPVNNLRYGTEYTVIIPQGAVLNNSGKPLEEEYSFSFITVPDPNGGSHSHSSAAQPVQSEVMETGLVTEDGLKVVVVSTQLPEKAASVRQAAAALGAKMLADPVELKLEAETEDGSNRSITDFGQYVDRRITLSGTADPARATGALYNPETGQLVPVPTVFETADGKTVAVIRHRGSGIYTVISNEKTFADVSAHWAKNEIETLAAKLIISGKGENNFDPQGKVTRAEFATLLVRALGLTGYAGPAGFRDNSGKWYTDAVNKAAQAGLVNGYSDRTFRPNATITRQEMAAMVRNAVRLTGIASETGSADEVISRFSDNTEIKDWAREAVAEAVQAGIINGNTKGEFNPEADATRAEAAVMLMRTLGYAGFMNGK